MSVPIAPPPTYSQQNQSQGPCESHQDVETQLLISPAPNAIQFQKGYLGADGERAAVEGELQIKGGNSNAWDSVTLSLRSYEAVDRHLTELNSTDIVAYSRSNPSSSSTTADALPSTIPFSIPLTPDTPQCIHTVRSSLSHELTATLYPVDRSKAPVSRMITVHTRRFTSHLLSFGIAPHTVSVDDPTLVQVQVPRTIYRAEEPIPVYITIPPPERSVVLDQGFTLRNVKAELVRFITTLEQPDGDEGPSTTNASSSDMQDDDDSDTSSETSSEMQAPSAAFLAAPEKPFFARPPSMSNNSEQVLQSANVYETVLSRSGASCRFHSSRPIRIRLVLHRSPQTASPVNFFSDLPNLDHGHLENESQCASITQTTLFHAVTFHARVHVTFVHASNHTERISTLTIPITLLPGPAPLPEIEPSIDVAYRKKHDRPPAKTVRRDDADISFSHAVDNQPGPSALPSGAPPPFDDAPPPFFSTSFEAEGSSSRLPTFLESETEILVPAEDHPASASSLPLPPLDLAIEGEGIIFGFASSEQYDGHPDEMQRSLTPPPSLEMARGDTDVTELAGLVNQPARALEALHVALDQHGADHPRDNLLPPPPPPMDDPLDPPPSIDSEYRSHASDPPPSIHSEFISSPRVQISPLNASPPSNQQSLVQTTDGPPPPMHDGSAMVAINQIAVGSPSHAPPPYLIPTNQGEPHDEHVTRPPPYVDFMPSGEDSPHR